MAHFAQIENGIVKQVIVVDNSNAETEEQGIAFCKQLLGQDTEWVQTSYNNNIRKRFAGIGYIYDADNDVFIRPQPYPSWDVNEDFEWQAPVDMPDDGNIYLWDEENFRWYLPE